MRIPTKFLLSPFFLKEFLYTGKKTLEFSENTKVFLENSKVFSEKMKEFF